MPGGTKRYGENKDNEGHPKKRKLEDTQPETVDLTSDLDSGMDRKSKASGRPYAQPPADRQQGGKYRTRDGRSSTSSGSSSGRTQDGPGARPSSSRHHHHPKPEGPDRQYAAPPEAAAMRDFYTILEVTRTSSQADIKKAYRRLALKWHPDKNPENQEEATIRFKEISEAYEVLIDDAKRRIYDQRLKCAADAKTRSAAGGTRVPRTFSFHGFSDAFRKNFDSKRRVYDQYGKEGLNTNANGGASRSRARQDPFAGFFEGPFADHFSPGFTFRDPEDVFREFFKDDPFEDIFGSFFGGSMFGGGPRRSRGNQVAQPSIFSPFGFGMNPFGQMGMGMNMNSFDMLENGGGGGGGGGFYSSTTFGSTGGGARHSSTSTRIVGNKKIVTQKVVDNGVETVTVSENGVLKSKTVNGVPQALGY